MHTVELLEEACAVAESLGYRIRQEWLGGTGGGACEFSGRKWIFIDLALNAIEQLDQVATALRQDPAIYFAAMSSALQRVLDVRVESETAVDHSRSGGSSSQAGEGRHENADGTRQSRRVA